MHGPSRRVLVAGHLHLDAPLQQMPAVPEEHHELLRDATLTAFETLIEATIDQAADALILTGGLFGPSPTLRGAATFRDGVETLLEAGIEVLWSPPQASQQQMLSDVRCLPRGLQLLTAEQPQQILCASRSAAGTATAGIRVDWMDRPASEPSAWNRDASSGWLRIGITQRSIGHLTNGMPLNAIDDDAFAIILSGSPHRAHSTRFQQTIYHAPGAIQFLEEGTYGPACATLLQIDPAGEIDLLTLETSPVRRELLELNLEPQTSMQELLEQAELEFLQLCSEREQSRARLIELHWQVRCSCERLEALESSRLQRQLAARLGETEQKIPVLHRVQLIPLFTGQSVVVQELREEYLEQQFLQQLSLQLTHQTETEQLLAALEKLKASQVAVCALPWKQLLEQIPARGVSHRAAELGLHALQGTLKAS